MAKRFVSIGECMVEMSGGEDGNYRLGFAGDTFNTAWYARALLPSDWQVDYVTALGDDRYSAQMRAFIDAAGIGTSGIQTIPGRRPGLYMIHQEGGDRHFTYWREASAARLMVEDRAALESAIIGADVVYFSGITMAILFPRTRGRLLKAIVRARDAGAKVVFDPNVRPALWSGPRAMQGVLSAAANIADIVLPTHGDEAGLFGDVDREGTAQRYRGEGVAEVVVKDGAAAALAVTAEEHAELAPPAAGRIIDTTGAGDSFNAGYVVARLSGATLHDSLAAAHRVAGIVIGHRGALVAPELVRT